MTDQFYGELVLGAEVDRILRNYFPDYSYKGGFFDIGAFEPIRISNSHHFFLNGWDVYAFEANPNKIDLLTQHRDHVFNYAISDEDSQEPLVFENVYLSDDWTASYSAMRVKDSYKEIFGWNNSNRVETLMVPRRRLDTIIAQEIPSLQKIDILSLDIEGYELECLQGLDLVRFPPKVMVIENADHNPVIEEYLHPFGYHLDEKISYNEYYVHE